MCTHADNPSRPRILFTSSLFKKYVEEAENVLNLKAIVPLSSENFNSFISTVKVYTTGQEYTLLLIIPFTDNANYLMHCFPVAYLC